MAIIWQYNMYTCVSSYKIYLIKISNLDLKIFLKNLVKLHSTYVCYVCI